MKTGLWLLLSLPNWYFSSIRDPLAGALAVIGVLGTVCLVVGLSLGIAMRERRLLLFIIPFLLSELVVFVAGVMRGQLGAEVPSAALVAFLAVQLMLSGFLIYRLTGARWAASALALFSMSYAFMATIIASMMLSEAWY